MVYPPEFQRKDQPPSRDRRAVSGFEVVGAVMRFVSYALLSERIGRDVVVYGKVNGPGPNGESATRYYRITCKDTETDGQSRLTLNGDTKGGLIIEGYHADDSRMIKLDQITLPRSSGVWGQKIQKRFAGLGAAEMTRLAEIGEAEKITSANYEKVVQEYEGL